MGMNEIHKMIKEVIYIYKANKINTTVANKAKGSNVFQIFRNSLRAGNTN